MYDIPQQEFMNFFPRIAKSLFAGGFGVVQVMPRIAKKIHTKCTYCKAEKSFFCRKPSQSSVATNLSNTTDKEAFSQWSMLNLNVDHPPGGHFSGK